MKGFYTVGRSYDAWIAHATYSQYTVRVDRRGRLEATKSYLSNSGAALTRVSSPVGEDVCWAGDGGLGMCSVRGFALKQGGGAYLIPERDYCM